MRLVDPEASWYRQSCLACQAEITVRGLCAACRVSTYPMDAACRHCALPLQTPKMTLCISCLKKPAPLTSAYAGFRYGGAVKALLGRFKNEGRVDLVRPLAILGAASFRQACQSSDILVPIPLHWRKLGRRGFNQSALLAQVMTSQNPSVRVPVLHALRRVRPTQLQGSLSANERRQNLRQAFRISRLGAARIVNRHVLVVDDVMTTGSTIFEAARALRTGGARAVSAWTLCRAGE